MDLKKIHDLLMSFCAYQDRTELEVRKRLLKLECIDEDANLIVKMLKEDNFLNEARFVESYISGKMSHKKWGINKVKYKLKLLGVDENLVDSGLENVDNEQYEQTIYELCIKKMKTTKSNSTFELKTKLINYLSSKGYEFGVLMKVVNTCIKEYQSDTNYTNDEDSY